MFGTGKIFFSQRIRIIKGRKNRRGNSIFAEENWKRREGITSRRIIYFSRRREKAGKEKEGILKENTFIF